MFVYEIKEFNESDLSASSKKTLLIDIDKSNYLYNQQNNNRCTGELEQKNDSLKTFL